MDRGAAQRGAVFVALWAIAAARAGGALAAGPVDQSGFYPPLPMATPVVNPASLPQNVFAPFAASGNTAGPAPATGAAAATTINGSSPTGVGGPGFIGGLDIQSAVVRLTSSQQPPAPIEDPDEAGPPRRASASPPLAPAPPESSDPATLGSASNAAESPDPAVEPAPSSNNAAQTGAAGPSRLPRTNLNPAYDPNFPGDPGPLDDDTSILRGIHDFISGRTFPTEGAPAYEFTASALLLHRTDAKSIPLVTDGGGQLLGAGDLGLGTAVGPRFDLTMRFASGYNLELVFFGIEGWHSQTSLTAAGNGLIVPMFGGDRFSHLTAAYSSRLFNEEINSSHAIWGPINILSGFRVIELNENLNLAGSGATNGSGNLKTRNWMPGLQIGAESTLVNRGPWSFDAYLKAGIYINAARLTTSQTGDVALASGSSFDAHEAFVGDLGCHLNYALPRDWTVTVGYQMLWMDRLALAPNQAATAGKVNFHGDAFLNGVQIGLVKLF